MATPCMRGPMGCAVCGATDDEGCPYEGLDPSLTEVRPPMVLGGDCSGEDGVCESCQ